VDEAQARRVLAEIRGAVNGETRRSASARDFPGRTEIKKHWPFLGLLQNGAAILF
jgi:hypothetical protein